jgi:hypothetical protein
MMGFRYFVQRQITAQPGVTHEIPARPMSDITRLSGLAQFLRRKIRRFDLEKTADLLCEAT